jgi:hypothetical protein
MGADGVAIAFVTREQGEELTAIENLINLQIPQEGIDGFQAAAPRVQAKDHVPPPKITIPVFGRQVRRYRRGL